MSARDEVRRYVRLLADWWTPPTETEARVEQVYNAVRAEVLREVEAEIDAAIDRNRSEFPDEDAMIARRLGMRAAERLVRGMREDGEKATS